MTVQTITLTYDTTTRALTASSSSIGTTSDVSSTRFAFSPSSGDTADVVFCVPVTMQTGRTDNPFIRFSGGYAVIPGSIMSRLRDDDVDIYLRITHTDDTVETSGRLTFKVVNLGNSPVPADTGGLILIRGSSWEWQSGVNYSTGSIASKGQYVYVSLSDNNTGHDPSSTSGYWASVTGAQGPTGPQGPPGQAGSQGPKGDPFTIHSTYASVQLMEAAYADVPLGSFTAISNSVETPSNAQLFLRANNEQYVSPSTAHYTFITDMSGATGLKGDPGEKGEDGAPGSPGAPFSISKTYASTSAMESDYSSVSSGAFVVISSSDSSNGYLFRREDVASPVLPSTAHFLFIVSMAGPAGPQGPTGPRGESIPAGGSTDYVLAKNSNADFDYKWVAQGSAPVTSVNGQQGVVVLDTDDISEGSDNKYMTSAQATKLNGIEEGAEVNVNADWNAASGDAQILNKPSLATVATSGAYGDLSGRPTIPDQLSDLSDDATHRLVTDTEKTTWNAKQSALTFDTAPASGSSNPVTSGGIHTAIQTALSSAVRPMGSCTAAELAQKTGMLVGDMWNVTTPFTIGDVTYPAGTNVVWTAQNVWDAMSGVVDLSGYVPTSRTVNSKALTGNITLNADDLGDGSTKVMMLATERSKLSGIASGAEVNVQSNWNTVDTNDDSYIQNKPSIPTATSDLTNDSGFITSSYHDATKEDTLNADQKRKITISTADPTGGSDGDIWLKYTA